MSFLPFENPLGFGASDFVELILISLLVAGAAQWYQPRSEGIAPAWIPLVFEMIAVVAVLWTIAELAFGASKRPKPL